MISLKERYEDLKEAAAYIDWPKTLARCALKFASHIVTSIAFGCLAVDLILWQSGPINEFSTYPIQPLAPAATVWSTSFFAHMQGLMAIKVMTGIVCYVVAMGFFGGFRDYPVQYRYRGPEVTMLQPGE